MSKPKAVLVSDIHFNLKNLELSSSALEHAFIEAGRLSMPLVIAGDMHDTKALLRGEVVNRLVDIFRHYPGVESYLMVGNHDRLNEQAPEHALNFLQEYTNIIDMITPVPKHQMTLIPYHHDPKELEEELKKLPPGDTLIMHQGVKDADKGEYVFDHSAIDISLLSPFRCFSGHYHRHQTIGTLTYIGSPFTMSFAEANDGPKGFLVINDDGSFEQVALNLRSHVVWDLYPSIAIVMANNQRNDDLYRIKLHGTSSEIQKMQAHVINTMPKNISFRIEKNITDSHIVTQPQKRLDNPSLIDSLIDASNEDAMQKEYLKQLWREVMK